MPAAMLRMCIAFTHDPALADGECAAKKILGA